MRLAAAMLSGCLLHGCAHPPPREATSPPEPEPLPVAEGPTAKPEVLPVEPPETLTIEPPANAEVLTYQFSRIYETAGLDMTVASHPYDGLGWTFITLADDSDPLARGALENLNASLLQANDQNSNLFFCGQLREPVLRAPSGESYKSFTLTHWYLTKPFAAAQPHGRKQAQLRRRDFGKAWDFQGDVALFHEPCSALPSSQRARR